jgi:Resolvase, N terminal domain
MIELRRAIDPNHWFVPRRRRPLRPARQLQHLQLVAGASWRRGGDRKGKQNTRPSWPTPICRGHLSTLLIAKLDRLARNVHFISGLMETGVPFVAADMPTATLFMLHICAAMAEAEGIAISTRTKAALTAAKARGVKLGNPWLLPGSPDQAPETREDARPEALGSFSAFHFKSSIAAQWPVELCRIGGIGWNWHDANW